MSKYSLKQYIEETAGDNFINCNKFIKEAKELKWSVFDYRTSNREIVIQPFHDTEKFLIDGKEYDVSIRVFFNLKLNEEGTCVESLNYRNVSSVVIIIWGKSGSSPFYSKRLGGYTANNYDYNETVDGEKRDIVLTHNNKRVLTNDYKKEDLDEHMIDAFVSHFITNGYDKIKQLIKKVSPNFDLNILKESFEEGMEVKGILRVSTIANGFRPPAKKLGDNLYELSGLTIKVERRDIKIDDQLYNYGGIIVVSMVIEIKNLADLDKYIRLKGNIMRDFCTKYVHLCGMIHDWGTALPTFDGYLYPDEIKIHEIRVTHVESSVIDKLSDNPRYPINTWQTVHRSGGYEKETFTRSDLIDPSLAEALTSHMIEEGLNQFKDKISNVLTDKQYDIVPEELKK